VANDLFRASSRSKEPFIRVNCAAISESLIESEFFGHEKGAFTGAVQRREGRFELANNGTILLDEISEISLKVQAKLLRVLQEKEFERVGGNKTIKVNVRVLATTNRDLLKSVKRNEFRQDLYYRLNVFPIYVPPLRERKEDVKVLSRAFLDRYARSHGVKIKGFSDEALKALIQHDWPGNVRELQNTIERAVILTESGTKLSASSLGLVASLGEASVSIPIESRETNGDPAADSSESVDRDVSPMSLEELEKKHILSVLEKNGWNRTKAAEILGISIRTLRNKITAYREQGEYIRDNDTN
jgi:transcriptional regulator with GAF, ATPase, and Fis domain